MRRFGWRVGKRRSLAATTFRGFFDQAPSPGRRGNAGPGGERKTVRSIPAEGRTFLAWAAFIRKSKIPPPRGLELSTRGGRIDAASSHRCARRGRAAATAAFSDHRDGDGMRPCGMAEVGRAAGLVVDSLRGTRWMAAGSVSGGGGALERKPSKMHCWGATGLSKLYERSDAETARIARRAWSPPRAGAAGRRPQRNSRSASMNLGLGRDVATATRPVSYLDPGARDKPRI